MLSFMPRPIYLPPCERDTGNDRTGNWMDLRVHQGALEKREISLKFDNKMQL
jgi:hypothetical protein